MPAVTSGLILVTGPNGFVGVHTLRALLAFPEYTVRAAVRTQDKADLLRNIFPDAKDRLTFVLVPDMSAKGAYDEAVNGVDGILHIASPVDLVSEDPQDLIRPAVNGTLGILESADQTGDKVGRIVQVSSIVSVDNGARGGVVNEDNWNDEDVEIVEREGHKAGPFAKYSASKVLAERALWKYVKAAPHKYDVTTILPAVVLGPSGTGGVDSSLTFLAPYLKPGIPESDLANPFHNVVDVRDLADSIVAALRTPAAGGERIIVSGEKLGPNDFAIAAEAFPEETKGATRGNHDPKFIEEVRARTVKFDSSKAERLLGTTFRPREETLKAAVATLVGK